MTLLVFGQTGQVARALATHAPDAVCLGRAEADLAYPETCAAAIKAHAPSAVINAAAYTAVDQAEDEEALAHKVNAEAPTAMAKACADLGVPFVHISTDYVFDGSGDTARAPDTPVAPQNAYGRTKRAGEIGVQDSGAAHAILRTSWVYDAHGKNFVTTMLRLAETRDTLSVVDDQIGGPTPADAIARACLTIVEHLRTAPDASGTYHFSGTPNVSWADFARTIFETAGKVVTVQGIPTSEYPTPAARPLNSRLDCSATETVFGIERPDWRADLATFLKEPSP
jgi:dTDP-4-dehydrorhamnose reductase